MTIDESTPGVNDARNHLGRKPPQGEELTGEELRDGCELRGHPMMGNACPCGKAVDWHDL